MKRYEGKVKWFDGKRGWGFLLCSELDKEVFVHYSNIQGTGFRNLEAEDEVFFDTVATSKGVQAVNVEKKTTVSPTQ